MDKKNKNIIYFGIGSFIVLAGIIVGIYFWLRIYHEYDLEALSMAFIAAGALSITVGFISFVLKDTTLASFSRGMRHFTSQDSKHSERKIDYEDYLDHGDPKKQQWLLVIQGALMLIVGIIIIALV